MLAGISSRVPALLEAHKLSTRAARVGFDWPEIGGLFDKLTEETAELREELKDAPVSGPPGTGVASSGTPQVSPELHERLEDEVGDLFFVLVNIARYLALDPESALRKTNRKFKRRFQWMEEQLRVKGRGAQQASMEELEQLWQQSEATGKAGVTETRQAATSDAGAALVIRKCGSLEEMQAAFALQKEVWSFSDADLIPVRMFVVASKIGGHVLGAFDRDEMIAFALAIPGTRNGHLYLHSHMLAVRQTYRNAGLGRKIKLHQREEALGRGFELMEWTFDPLEIKNSYLNIEKLGAITRRYNVNQYGITSSPLQGGLPTDRLVAEWWMKSRRVEDLLANGSAR